MDKGSVKRKVLQMVEVGFTEDFVSRSYDYINMLAIITNLVASILFTFDSVSGKYYGLLFNIELITVCFFLVDYCLRIWTADLLFPDKTEIAARMKYALSFTGIIDLLSFLPFFLPVFFPAGSVAFRMLRVARIFRLFRINAYYDSLNVITSVIKSKRQQLLSSVFIILVLMVASSLCMYSLEHEAQPEVYKNAFSGIWWATSTLLTVGYGDIYPVTTGGQILGIIITFLGCGMVAIPTGIISAGFVEQYSKLREMTEKMLEHPLSFIKVLVKETDDWKGKRIDELVFPEDVIVAVIQRNDETILPGGDVIIMEGDIVILGSRNVPDRWDVVLQEVIIKELHPWNGVRIKDLDISRQSFIIAVKRGEESIVPNEDFLIRAEDVIILFSKKKIAEADRIVI